MKTYDVFMQAHPRLADKMQIKDEETGRMRWVQGWELNLVRVGSVVARTGRDAIALARKTFKEFRAAPRNTLNAYPVVQDMGPVSGDLH